MVLKTAHHQTNLTFHFVIYRISIPLKSNVIDRKLKNRVAAQTSRDRKKAKMDEMDYRIRSLEERNEKLVDEVSLLKDYD